MTSTATVNNAKLKGHVRLYLAKLPKHGTHEMTDKHPYLLPNGLLDPDMPADEMRLYAGELTTDELLTARAVIRWANECSFKVLKEVTWRNLEIQREEANRVGGCMDALEEKGYGRIYRTSNAQDMEDLRLKYANKMKKGDDFLEEIDIPTFTSYLLHFGARAYYYWMGKYEGELEHRKYEASND